jgi:hypothetical protein
MCSTTPYHPVSPHPTTPTTRPPALGSTRYRTQPIHLPPHIPRQRPHHPQRRLLHNLVELNRLLVVEVLAIEFQPEIVCRDHPLLVLDLCLDRLDGVGGIDVEGDCFAAVCVTLWGLEFCEGVREGEEEEHTLLDEDLDREEFHGGTGHSLVVAGAMHVM